MLLGFEKCVQFFESPVQTHRNDVLALLDESGYLLNGKVVHVAQGQDLAVQIRQLPNRPDRPRALKAHNRRFERVGVVALHEGFDLSALVVFYHAIKGIRFRLAVFVDDEVAERPVQECPHFTDLLAARSILPRAEETFLRELKRTITVGKTHGCVAEELVCVQFERFPECLFGICILHAMTCAAGISFMFSGSASFYTIPYELARRVGRDGQVAVFFLRSGTGHYSTVAEPEAETELSA